LELIAGIDRYPISTLDSESVDVWLTLGDREVVGHVTFTKSGRPRYRVRIDRRTVEDLPKHATPALWRPIDPGDWPERLPEPAALTRHQMRADPQPSEPEDFATEGDAWPYPGLRLGRPTDRPESAREAEARLLRALRTREHANYDPIKVQTAWPGELFKSIEALNRWIASTKTKQLGHLRPDDYADIYIDASALEAVFIPFRPTHRDVSDFENGLPFRWLSSVPKKYVWLFDARSANPPKSWAWLAHGERVTVHTLKKQYEDAVEALYLGALKC
jgi:hypothetical protein